MAQQQQRQQQWVMVPQTSNQQPGGLLPPPTPQQQAGYRTSLQVVAPQLSHFARTLTTGKLASSVKAHVDPGVEIIRPDSDALHPAFAHALSSSSTPSKQLKGGGGVRRAMMVMPKLLLFAFWQQFYAYFSGDPFNAFVNSMISCPRPEAPNCSIGSRWVEPENLDSVSLDLPEDSLLNENVTKNGICVAVDKYHSAWSLSDKCMDKDEVLQRTTRINGINGWVACFFGLFAVFIAGQAIDVVGRKPVLMLFLSSNIVVKAILFASTFMTYAGFALALSIQNIIEVAFAAGVEPALNSMITDYSRGNEELRGDGFAALGVIMHAADVFAFFAGYPVLKLHMTDYAWFWGPLIVVSLIAFVLFNYIPCSKLEETLDKSNDFGTFSEEDEDEEREWGDKSCPRKVCHVCKVLFRESIAGFHLVATDPFLAQLILLNALVGQAIGGSWNLAGTYLLGWGYEQANASLARPAWHIGLMIGAALSSPIIRCLGTRATFAVGLILLALGFGACGMGGPLATEAEKLFWCGTVGLGSIGQGLLIPSFNSLISVRVNDAEQGKMFSFVIVINTLCGLAIGQLWPQKFYDARSSGWRKGLPWLASMAVFVVMLLWFLVLCSPLCRWRPRKEESDCGEDTSSEEESK